MFLVMLQISQAKEAKKRTRTRGTGAKFFQSKCSLRGQLHLPLPHYYGFMMAISHPKEMAMPYLGIPSFKVVFEIRIGHK